MEKREGIGGALNMNRRITLKPVTFSITNQDDLLKLQAFEKEHEKCREKYPDATGALFVYEVIPTGIGLAWKVKCSCGEELMLSGDLF